MVTATATWIAQKEAVESGKKGLHGNVTDGVLRMYEAIRNWGPSQVTLDRAVLFTELFEGTENQPLVLRWAKALRHFVEEAPVTLFGDGLIVAGPTLGSIVGGIVHPDLDGRVMPAGVDLIGCIPRVQTNSSFHPGARVRTMAGSWIYGVGPLLRAFAATITGSLLAQRIEVAKRCPFDSTRDRLFRRMPKSGEEEEWNRGQDIPRSTKSTLGSGLTS